jgi:hypothetical protein
MYGYKAMGDAAVLPLAKFAGESFLIKLMEAAYGSERREQQIKSVQG